MRTMICCGCVADKGPFRTVRCSKFGTDERGAATGHAFGEADRQFHVRVIARPWSSNQEKELVSDPKLLLVGVHALNNWTIDEIVETYALSKSECIRQLARLDRLGIIDLLPNNKIRVRVTQNFSWLPDGPIQQYFHARVQDDFFRSHFDGAGELMLFVSGMLSRPSLSALQSRLRKLRAEFSELHHQDLELPLAERFGTSMLLAVRPWTPDSFKRFQRKSTRRTTSPAAESSAFREARRPVR
jgi:hypothetical protein